MRHRYSSCYLQSTCDKAATEDRSINSKNLYARLNIKINRVNSYCFINKLLFYIFNRDHRPKATLITLRVHARN